MAGRSRLATQRKQRRKLRQCLGWWSDRPLPGELARCGRPYSELRMLSPPELDRSVAGTQELRCARQAERQMYNVVFDTSLPGISGKQISSRRGCCRIIPLL